MKSLNYILSLVLFFCLSGIILAQDVDEIIAKHIDAHGGAKNWEKIESIKLTGKFTAFSEEQDFLSIKTNTGCYYGELYLGHHAVVEGFNGEAGWTIDPWQEILFPRRLNKTEINVFFQKAQFFTPFYNYKEKGHKVEYTGEQEVDGINTHVLKLTRTNGHTETWYLDAETYLEYKCESAWVDFMYPSQAESFYDDFRTVKGVVIPFYVERMFNQRNRMTVVENVVINGEIDESLFTMSRKEGMERIAFLEGDFDVKVEIMTRRGTWYPFGETTSKIEFETLNMLKEIIDYEVVMPQLHILNYTYSEETGLYRLCIFNDFFSEYDVFEGELTIEGLILDNTKVKIGDSQSDPASYMQIKISEITDNGFTVTVSASSDNGVTWQPREKLIYTRKE